MDQSFIILTAIILSLALLGGYIATSLKQYIVIGYILMGVLIGSIFTSITHSQNYISILASIGVTLLIFLNGTEFSLERIKNYRKVIVWGSIIQTIFVSIIMTFLIHILHLKFISAITIGIALSMSSTVIVSKVLKDLDRNYSQIGEITISWLMIQDLLTIPVIIFFNSNLPTHYIIFPIIIAILKSVVILIIIYYLGSAIIPYALDKIAQTEIRELLVLSVIAILFIIISIASLFGISTIVAAFIAGLIISKSLLHHQISQEIKPFKDLFSVFFFILIGTVTPITFVIGHIFQIILAVIFLIVVKTIITFAILKFAKFHSNMAFNISSNVMQAGEFSFVIGTVALSSHFIGDNAYYLLLAVTIITMILTPFTIQNDVKIYQTLRDFTKRILPILYKYIFDKDQELADHELKHPGIIIVGYGRVGKHTAEILRSNHMKTTVIDFNQNLINAQKKKDKTISFIYGEADSIEIIKSSGIEHAKILILTTPDIETNYKIVQIVKNLNTNVKIIARSHLPKHKEILKSFGVEHIVEPEKETALSIVHILLQYLGKNKREINAILQRNELQD